MVGLRPTRARARASRRLQLEEIDAITIAMEKLNVTRSITEAARELGYPIMKPEQLDITSIR